MSFSSSTDIQSRSPDTAEPAQHRQPWRRRPTAAGAVRLAAALAGLAAIIAFLVIAVSRLAYPFTVEWLESNSLVEVHRILAGQPVYTAPTAGYVPDGYPPLYFAVSAAAASLFGVSYLPLRLVSLVSSLACFALLGRLVQRETGSVAAGAGAAGLFAATYFAAGTWFDVGRVDSLFLALSIGGLYAARWMSSTRGAIAAGVLLAAAFLTKQTGLAEGIAVVAALLPGPRRRLACIAALAEVATAGLTSLVLALTSGGWYLYYVFEQMSEHSLDHRAFAGFWTSLLFSVGLAVCAAVIGARRAPLVLLAGCAALVTEGYAATLHSGSGANNVLPGYLAVALLAGLALANRGSAWWAAALSGLLVLVQSALLLSGFQPARAIPTSTDRAIGERLLSGIRAFGGTVAIPEDPGLSLMAGMTPAAHQDAANDVLRASNQTAITSFTHSAAEAIAARKFSAIITNGTGLPHGYPPWLTRYYHRCPQRLMAGVPASEFLPVAGISIRPAWVWLPSDRGSCQAAVRILDGTDRRGRS